MTKYTFIYKNNNDDRDCVKYADLKRINKLECGHYFPQIILSGACYSGDFDKILEDENVIDEIYQNITTILTVEEFKKLAQYNKNINSLGYGLDTKPEKQELAHSYYKDIENIIQKLESEENQALFEKVKEEEIEHMKEEYNLTDEDIQQIFDNYYLDYKDRGIIGYIYSDTYDLGESLFSEYVGNVPPFVENHFNYESFGESLIDNENYIELDDGRVVSLNY